MPLPTHPAVGNAPSSTAQQHYGATDGECLAVIWAVDKFRPYLYSTHFELRTDPAALQYFMTAQNFSSRLLRWFLLLQEYQFDIRYRPGLANGNADGLSRLPQGPPCPPQVLLTLMAGPDSSQGGGVPLLSQTLSPCLPLPRPPLLLPLLLLSKVTQPLPREAYCAWCAVMGTIHSRRVCCATTVTPDITSCA